jgi:hypothetical protein
MIENITPTSQAQATSLLAIHGLLPRLRAACGMLEDTPQGVVRSTTLYMPVVANSAAPVVQAIKLFAKEHCVEAEVELGPGRIVVQLRRSTENAHDERGQR